MQRFLLDHFEGCTPLIPCLSCKALEYLRGALKAEQFVEFVAMLGTATGVATTTTIFPEVDLARPWDEVLPRMSVRTYNALKNENIQTIAELVAKTEAELLQVPNFGRRSLDELRSVLGAQGLRLNM